MRPLYLSIKGFGPYLDLKISEKDFKLLTENRLFLISGEIGAGKTTIFDAILYALYGEGTIEGRTPGSLISHFLKSRSNIYPEIDFKFFLDGKTYRVIRRPPFKGRPENATLWIENILTSSKKNEIKAKIKELLGLDAKQFKKVFLIPQGEYRKILLSDEKERKQLLETIFETQKFSEIEEFLKTKLKDFKNKYLSLKDREEDLKRLSQTSNLKELEQKIFEKEKKLKENRALETELRRKEKELESRIKASELLIQAFQKFEELSQKLEILKQKEPEIKQKQNLLKKLIIIKEHMGYYEGLKHLWKVLKDLHLKRKKLVFLLETSSKELNRIKEDLKSLLKKEKEVELKKNKLQRFREFEQQIKEKIRLENKLKEVRDELETEIKCLKKLQFELEEVKLKLEELQRNKELIIKVIELVKEKEEIEVYLKGFEEQDSLKNQEIELEIGVKALKKEVESLESLKRDLEIKHQAEILSEFLKEGEPCPVCGSVHHPEPVKPQPALKENLKRIEKSIIEKKNFLEIKQKELFKLKASLNHLKERLKGLEKDELIKKLRGLEERLGELKKFLGDVKDKSELESLNIRIEDLKKRAAALEKKEKKLREKVEILKTKEANLKGQLKVIENFTEDKLNYNYIKNLEKEISEWEEKKSQIDESLKKLEQENIKLTTELKSLEEFLGLRLIEYKENLKKICDLKNKVGISSIAELKDYIPYVSKINEFEKEIERFYQELNRTRDNIEEVRVGLKNDIDYKKLCLELEELKKEREKLELTLSKLHYQIGGLESEVFQLKEILSSWKDIKRDKKELEEKIPLLEKIYNLIIGKNSKKISFHSFVLSIYIKFILKRANYYLKEFSFGRYKFVEEKVLEKKLSLEVFDNYTGSQREVKTLSGGESFLATLSLALGTSDVILYLFRSKPFECLFIDEGFGSLDETSLEKVVNIFLNLASQSGRIIGIISHLKDLKEKFPVVLEVYKDQVKGSYIKIRKKF